jgi:hypothetical protein
LKVALATLFLICGQEAKTGETKYETSACPMVVRPAKDQPELKRAQM